MKRSRRRRTVLSIDRKVLIAIQKRKVGCGSGLLSLLIFLRLRLSDATKAIDVVSETNIRVAGILVVAVSGTTALCAEPPRAAANNFRFTIGRSSGIFPRRLLIIIHLVKVVAPFPHVAAHVVKTPWIGLFLAYWPGTSARVFVEPGVIAQL